MEKRNSFVIGPSNFGAILHSSHSSDLSWGRRNSFSESISPSEGTIQLRIELCNDNC